MDHIMAKSSVQDHVEVRSTVLAASAVTEPDAGISIRTWRYRGVRSITLLQARLTNGM